VFFEINVVNIIMVDDNMMVVIITVVIIIIIIIIMYLVFTNFLIGSQVYISCIRYVLLYLPHE